MGRGLTPFRHGFPVILPQLQGDATGMQPSIERAVVDDGFSGLVFLIVKRLRKADDVWEGRNWLN
jgi:hypothetical protein